MQVFKLYWKLTRSKWKTFLLYLLIYLSVFALMIGFRNDSATHYEASTVVIGVIDEDHSELSGLLTDYLEKTHQVVFYEDAHEMQDGLFYQYLNLTLHIPDGFEEAFLDGQGELDYQGNQGLSASLASRNIAFYLEKMYALHRQDPQLSLSAQQEILLPILSQQVTVDFSQSNQDQSSYVSALNYLSYVIMALLTTMISSCLIEMRDPQSYTRMLASPMSAKRITLELLLGAGSFALVILFAFSLILMRFFPAEIFSSQGALWLCHLGIYTLACYTLSVLLTHLVTRFRHPKDVLSMLSQLISLGSAFLGGAFLSQSLINSTMSRIASFTPLYWYVKGNTLIQTGTFSELAVCWGLLTLFTLAFALLTMYVNFHDLARHQ